MTRSVSETSAGYTIVDYDVHARTCAPDDFWSQVKRTRYGKPVPDSHIDMIVQAIKQHLALQPDDCVLDLACGNGALSQRLFDSCAGLVGVDLSEYLIQIANQYFARPPDYLFVERGVAEYLSEESQPDRFTKVLCYGSFAYFSDADAKIALRLMNNRFTSIDTIFIGNLPDLDRMEAFYGTRTPDSRELVDPRSQIGIWRTRSAFESMATAAGWDVEFKKMPPAFYSVDYRYDAVLHKRSSAAA
jgi:SAM-dependent methyltransferase